MSMDMVKESKLPVIGVIAETWKKVKGMKLAYLGAIISSLVTLVVIIVALSLLPQILLPHPENAAAFSSAQAPATENVASTAAANTGSPTMTINAVPGAGDNLQTPEASKKQVAKMLEHPGILLFGLGMGLIIYYLLFLVVTCLARLGVYRAFDLPLTIGGYFATYLKASLVLTVFLFYMFLYMSVIFPLFLPIFFVIFAFVHASPWLVLASTLLLSLPALFILVRLELGLPIILIKENDVFSAMGESWQSTRSYFWRLFFLNVINFLLILVPLIPLFLLKHFNSWEMIALAVAGVVMLFWTIPYVGISFGVIYKRLKSN